MGLNRPSQDHYLNSGLFGEQEPEVQSVRADTRQSMRSSKSQSKTAHPSKPLIPLSLARPDRYSNLLEAVEPQRTRNDLILSPNNVQTFEGLINEFRHGDTLRRHGLPIRSKLLFCGPPGCGKTITAEIFANELGLPMFVARLDALFSSFLGETASNLAKAFEVVNEQPCLLFLDEFDALARSRGDKAEHNELRRVVNSLLMMIDRFKGRGFLIAATNLEQSLDLAIWRRFDEVILFDKPGDEEIPRFLMLKTRNFPTHFNIVSKSKSLRGLSYADIERVCLNAIKRSILAGHDFLSELEFDFALRDEQARQKVQTYLTSKN